MNVKLTFCILNKYTYIEKINNTLYFSNVKVIQTIILINNSNK